MHMVDRNSKINVSRVGKSLILTWGCQWLKRHELPQVKKVWSGGDYACHPHPSWHSIQLQRSPTNWLIFPRYCSDKHILYILNSPTRHERWGTKKTCISEWQELRRDMRNNANLHDYTDRWVIYLCLFLTAILDEGRMSSIRSCIL